MGLMLGQINLGMMRIIQFYIIRKVDCTWTEWMDFPYTNPGPRADGTTTTKCKNLVCNGDGMAPEEGLGEKNRHVKFQAGPGGLECDGNSKDTCKEPCPGNKMNGLPFEHRNGI